MTGQVLQLFSTVFEYCVSWASQVYDSIQAKPFIYAAFIIALVASLLLLPLRGHGISVSGRAFFDYTAGSVRSKNQHHVDSSGKWQKRGK